MSENPHAGQGSVLLDIGGDVGALVVAMPASMVGTEIEIAPVGQGRGHEHEHGHAHDGHPHRPHVAVVDRPVGGATMPSLVFPELVEGTYELFDKGGHAVLLKAAITGGEVTFIDWPASGGEPV
ncbi:hypothetical protein ISU10_18045 [Nocardioides agariphilus]|jgi:hypothetical protein|uniref:Uncharacterized protein n=1 Tax=Nocardioides agariphilus TaxID=433664 RepID=A0A930VLF4_9ACTN|nr:hypothetical protein [Nocardioides agariphilus]MBF4769674.1 hypothetical protein [Nocardioides agariphilus]